MGENEKVFEHFLEAPLEVRMMIIDEMRVVDRCRFTRCSKLSSLEAKSSKHYIWKLGFHIGREELDIEVMYDEKHCRPSIHGYILVFKKYSVECFSLKNCENMWRRTLENSTDLHQYATAYFKKLLHKYQKTIRRLKIICDSQSTDDFGIQSLNNLKHLTLGSVHNMSQFLSKIRKPLKSFDIFWEISCTNILDLEQMYQVHDRLCASFLKLNKQQFEQLSASHISIHIGDLTVNDIFDFIRSWQNGIVRKNEGYWTWNLENLSFNVKKLFELLKADQASLTTENLVIKHLKEKGITAKLTNRFGELKFEYKKENGNENKKEIKWADEEDEEENNSNHYHNDKNEQPETFDEFLLQLTQTNDPFASLQVIKHFINGTTTNDSVGDLLKNAQKSLEQAGVALADTIQSHSKNKDLIEPMDECSLQEYKIRALSDLEKAKTDISRVLNVTADFSTEFDCLNNATNMIQNGSQEQQ